MIYYNFSLVYVFKLIFVNCNLIKKGEVWLFVFEFRNCDMCIG